MNQASFFKQNLGWLVAALQLARCINGYLLVPSCMGEWAGSQSGSVSRDI